MAAVVVRPGNQLLSISFAADLDDLKRELPDWAANRIPSITRNALNDAVVEARDAEKDKIRGIFDRPTPFTVRSPRYRKATNQTLTAWVYIDDEPSKGGVGPAKYLMPQVMGGARGAKRFEEALRDRGILGAGEYAVPAAGYRRNQYGNVSKGVITAILSQLQAAERAAGYMMNETATSRARNIRAGKARYFVPSGTKADKGTGRLPRGIYERRGNTIRAVLVFVRQPKYRKRYDFGQAATAKVERVFWAYWQRYFYAEVKKHTSR